MMRNQGLAEDSPPKKYIPRRREQETDKDLTCLKLDFPPELAFETASCLLFPNLHVEHKNQCAVAESNQSICVEDLVLESTPLFLLDLISRPLPPTDLFKLCSLLNKTVMFSRLSRLFRFVALPLRDYARSNISRKNAPSTDAFEYCWLL